MTSTLDLFASICDTPEPRAGPKTLITKPANGQLEQTEELKKGESG